MRAYVRAFLVVVVFFGGGGLSVSAFFSVLVSDTLNWLKQMSNVLKICSFSVKQINMHFPPFSETLFFAPKLERVHL